MALYKFCIIVLLLLLLFLFLNTGMLHISLNHTTLHAVIIECDIIVFIFTRCHWKFRKVRLVTEFRRCYVFVCQFALCLCSKSVLCLDDFFPTVSTRSTSFTSRFYEWKIARSFRWY